MAGRYLPNQAIGVVTIPPVEGEPQSREHFVIQLRQSYSFIFWCRRYQNTNSSMASKFVLTEYHAALRKYEIDHVLSSS